MKIKYCEDTVNNELLYRLLIHEKYFFHRNDWPKQTKYCAVFHTFVQ